MSRWQQFEQHVERAVNGTFQLGPRLWAWPWESRGGRQLVGRLIAIGLSAFGLWRLGNQWHWIWAAAVGVTILVGYNLNDAEPEPEDGEDDWEDEPDDGEPVTALSPAETRQLIIDSVHHLADGRANVHLDQLRDHMGGDELDMDLSEFRRWVEAHGVHVRDSVKARGEVRIGVRVSDLQQAAADPADTTPPIVPPDLLQDW